MSSLSFSERTMDKRSRNVTRRSDSSMGLGLRLLRKPLSIARLTSGRGNISVIRRRTYISEDKTYMGPGGENIHCLLNCTISLLFTPTASFPFCTFMYKRTHRTQRSKDSLSFCLRLLLGLDVRLRSVRQQRRHVVDFPELPREARRVQEGTHVEACDMIRSHTTA